ncbi:OmpH family outer membrane protein [candidate division FCPU426 bacterium]|nr:OmpH family outer membrane protein [candidate division FCPU426 bacterium]
MMRNKAMLGFWLLAAVAVLGLSTSAWSKVAVVDTAKVVKEYKKTQEAQTRLEKELEDKKNELKKMNEDLEKEKNDLDKQKGIVSEKKYEKMAEKFEGKQDIFREKYRETQNALMNKQRTLLEGIVNDVKTIVEEIAKKEKYDLVLDKETILYYNGDDITYKVLDRLNAK